MEGMDITMEINITKMENKKGDEFTLKSLFNNYWIIYLAWLFLFKIVEMFLFREVVY